MIKFISNLFKSRQHELDIINTKIKLLEIYKYR